MSGPTRQSLPPLYTPALLNKGHSLRPLSESEPESACTIRVPFQITEEDTDPVASDSSNQLDQETGCGFIETAPATKKKKLDSAMDEACGLLRAIKKFKKKMSSPYLENLWRIKFEI
jgi:hypothetical protein